MSDHEEYLAHSVRLCAKLEQLARDDMRGVHPEFYRLTVEDYGGSGAVVVERVQPPYRHVSVWKSTVEALLAAESEGTPFESRVARISVTSDTAALLMSALRRVFPDEASGPGAGTMNVGD